MNCIITSPSETTTYTNLISITLPAVSGEIQIYKGHAESFIVLKKGSITLRMNDEKKINIQIADSECYIKENIVTIII